MDLISGLPDGWKHSITLISNPGRDDRGDVKPGTKTTIEGCLLAVQEVSDLNNLSSESMLKARIFIPKNVAVTSTDQITTHAPAPVVGRWAVEGPAIQWPFGTEVRVEWEGGSDG